MLDQFSQPDQLRVLIIGGSALNRAGLRTILHERDIDVIGVGSTLEPFDQALPNCDVMIVFDPAELVSINQHETAEFAMLLVSDEFPRQAPYDRVWGMMSPEATAQEVWLVLQTLAAGFCVFPPEFLNQRDDEQIMLQTFAPVEPLSQRERDVLQLLAEGLTNRQIALRMNISEHTVKFHCSSIFSKLNVASRTEAIRVGTQSGLISW